MANALSALKSQHACNSQKSLWQEPFTHEHIYNSAHLLGDHTSWM